jgi:hypothetical protein
MSRTIEIAPTPTHSAGTWQAQQEGHTPETGFPVWVVVGPESAICRIYSFAEDERPGTAEANATLIAAAPDMKKALEHLLSTIKNTGGLVHHENGTAAPAIDEDWIDLGDAVVLAEAAFKKAGGVL